MAIRRDVTLGFSRKDAAGVIARIYSADRACIAGVQTATREAGEFCRELTQFLAPRRTGFMADHVRTVYAADGLAFETGWSAADFAGAGLPFYPPYQEFGTRFMPAQPSLYPAFKDTQPFYRERIRALVRDAVQRLKNGRGAS